MLILLTVKLVFLIKITEGVLKKTTTKQRREGALLLQSKVKEKVRRAVHVFPFISLKHFRAGSSSLSYNEYRRNIVLHCSNSGSLIVHFIQTDIHVEEKVNNKEMKRA